MERYIQLLKENKKVKKVTISAVSVFLAVVLIAVSVTVVSHRKNKVDVNADSAVTDFSTDGSTEQVTEDESIIFVDVEEEASEVQSDESTAEAIPDKENSQSQAETTTKKSTTPLSSSGGASNKNVSTGSSSIGSGNINSNVFLDALKYTGYDVSGFVAKGEYGKKVSGSMLSGIGYNDGGASGLETTSSGKPDISLFKRKGMCCATYAAYVFFNYLPNVAGIDTSFLTQPAKTTSAASWYTAAESWVSGGAATKIPINSSTKPKTSSLSKLNNVPIGSLLLFKKGNSYSHVGIYAGTKNGHYYLTHVGNDRGPEISVIDGLISTSGGFVTLVAAYTPIYLKGAVGVEITDDAGKAVSGAKIGVYSDSDCKNLKSTLTTDSNGKAVYGYSSGKYLLDVNEIYYFKEISAPTGYDVSTQVVSAKVVKEKITYATTSIVDNRQGIITATKYDDAGTKLGSGYVFAICSDKACTKQITTMTTNSGGVATSGYLSAGTYYVKELAIPSTDKTHKLNSTVYTVTVTKGGTTSVNNGKFVNYRMTGTVTVKNTSEDGIVEGIKFRLYGTADTGTKVDMIVATNAKGVATFSNVLIGTYTVEEVDTHSRYETPKIQTVTVKDGQTSTVTFKNILKHPSEEITKTDF